MSDEQINVGTITKNPDGSYDSQLEHTYEGHSRADVWRALTEPDLIAQWIAQGSVELHKGGKVKIDFVDSGTLIESEVLEITPEHTLSYSWSSGDEPARPLKWELEDADGGAVRVKLAVHTPAGEDAAKACAGFEGHLEMLGGVLEGVPMKFPFELYVAARKAYSAQLEG